MVKGVFAAVRKKWHILAILSLVLGSGSVLGGDAAIALDVNKQLKAADITVAPANVLELAHNHFVKSVEATVEATVSTLDSPEPAQTSQVQAAEMLFAPLHSVAAYSASTYASTYVNSIYVDSAYLEPTSLAATFSPEIAPLQTRKAADIEVALLVAPTVAEILFYGQAPQAGELAHDYLVFEKQGEQLAGVIYQPQSEYACFQGTVGRSGLQLAVTSPFDQTVASYGIAFDTAASQIAGQPQSHMELAGFHAIADIGTQEQNLLTQCL